MRGSLMLSLCYWLTFIFQIDIIFKRIFLYNSVIKFLLQSNFMIFMKGNGI